MISLKLLLVRIMLLTVAGKVSLKRQQQVSVWLPTLKAIAIKWQYVLVL